MAPPWVETGGITAKDAADAMGRVLRIAGTVPRFAAPEAMSNEPLSGNVIERCKYTADPAGVVEVMEMGEGTRQWLMEDPEGPAPGTDFFIAIFGKVVIR